MRPENQPAQSVRTRAHRKVPAPAQAPWDWQSGIRSFLRSSVRPFAVGVNRLRRWIAKNSGSARKEAASVSRWPVYARSGESRPLSAKPIFRFAGNGAGSLLGKRASRLLIRLEPFQLRRSEIGRVDFQLRLAGNAASRHTSQSTLAWRSDRTRRALASALSCKWEQALRLRSRSPSAAQAEAAWEPETASGPAVMPSGSVHLICGGSPASPGFFQYTCQPDSSLK